MKQHWWVALLHTWLPGSASITVTTADGTFWNRTSPVQFLACDCTSVDQGESQALASNTGLFVPYFKSLAPSSQTVVMDITTSTSVLLSAYAVWALSLQNPPWAQTSWVLCVMSDGCTKGVCVCVLCRCVHSHAHICRSQRLTLGVFLSHYLSHISLDSVSHWIWSSLIWLACLGRKPHGLLLSSALGLQMSTPCLDFYMVSGDLNSNLHACAASTLQTKHLHSWQRLLC